MTGRLLGTAARLVEHSWNARLREHGVSHAGLIVLSTLGRGPTSQRDLADDQHVTEQTIGRTIAHLESTGHVIRRSDPADRRRRVVELTESGVDPAGRDVRHRRTTHRRHPDGRRAWTSRSSAAP